MTIPNTATGIGSYAFLGCTGLESIKIGNKVSSIGLSAFGNCNNLTKTEFASIESLCSIKYFLYTSNPLYYAHNLYINGKKITKLEIPQTVNEISYGAFAGCTSITSASISSSSIRGDAFHDCTALTEVTLGESVSSIKGSAFVGCTGLKEITIPGSVTEILANPFVSCSSLKEIKVVSNNKYFTAKNGVLYSKDLKTYIAFPGGQSSVKILNTVETIGDYAFYGCSGLKSIDIPNSVTTISERAFYGCNGLTSIEIPNSITKIGNFAFTKCEGITRITIPNSVEKVGTSAFATSDVVKEVYYAASNPLEFNMDIFYYHNQRTGAWENNAYNTATLYVPAAAVEKCKAINPWKNFSNIEAYEFLGIEEISTDFNSEDPYEVYNLNGVKVGDSIDALTPGIYIMRQGATTKKIAVQ